MSDFVEIRCGDKDTLMDGHDSVHTVFLPFYKNIMAIKVWKRLCIASHFIT